MIMSGANWVNFKMENKPHLYTWKDYFRFEKETVPAVCRNFHFAVVTNADLF